MRTILWAYVLAAAIVVAIAFGHAGLRVDWSNSSMQLIHVVVLIGMALYRQHLTSGPARIAVDTLEAIGLFIAISVIGGLGSYAVAAGSYGFVDDMLAGVDRSMGFDWLASYRFVAARPWLAELAKIAYSSIFLSPLVILAVLVMTGRVERARLFLLAFAIALTITIIVFHYLPARSALAHNVGLDPQYLPSSGLSHIGIIDHLRSGQLTDISPRALVGLITFPSFHAVSALLFIWAAWPVRWARPVAVVVNIAMLAATPVEGTHYLIDIFGGLVVAVMSIGLAKLPQIMGVHFARGIPLAAPVAA